MPRFVVSGGRILLVLTLAVVAWLSLTPSGQIGPAGWDKVEHALAYAAIGFFLMLSFRGRVSRPGTMIPLVAIAIAYGVGLEFLQRLVGRDFDLFDMLADAIGAFAGAGVGIAVRRLIGVYTRRRTSEEE